NAYLMKPGKQNQTRFYLYTEPFFVKMNNAYASSLGKFLKNKWWSFPSLAICIVMIGVFYSLLPKETAPYDDRSHIGMNVTAPEGVSYEYMERFMNEMTDLINDSIPEKKVSLIITSPGWGSSSVNSGRATIALVDPSERDRTQKEIAADLARWTKNYENARVSISETPTIAVNRRGG